MHEHVNIHILLSLLWDCVHIAVCEKCLVRIEESVLLQVVCIHTSHTHTHTLGLLPDPSPTGPEILSGFGSVRVNV